MAARTKRATAKPKPRAPIAAKKLRTVSDLLALLSAVMTDIALGLLPSSVANRINRLTGRVVRDAENADRLPTKSELFELRAALVGLLTEKAPRRVRRKSTKSRRA
jgi:hypothetical protein